MGGGGKDFVVVTAIRATEITYISDSKKKINHNLFLKNWEGLVLIAEPNLQSGEPNYVTNAKKEKAQQVKKNLLVAAAIIIGAMIIFSIITRIDTSLQMHVGYLTITKLVGVAIAALLLVYELDKTNSFAKQLCTAGQKTNCSAVLNSKAAGVVGVKWSEVGFLYFTSFILFLFYPNINFAIKIPYLAIASTLAAPYVLFSIFYQYKVIKQWCILCLATQAILFAEFVWAVFSYWQHP